MTDPIDSVRMTRAAVKTERVTRVKSLTPIKREDRDSETVLHDQLDIAPAAHLSNAADVIDLSLEMIRALINGELPPEAVAALGSFAALGDFSDPAAALDNCDRVQSKSQDFIPWEKTQTLAQALASAAR